MSFEELGCSRWFGASRMRFRVRMGRWRSRLGTLGYTSYCAPASGSPRPVVFCFPGGPGMSTAVMQWSGLGPFQWVTRPTRRVRLAPPAELLLSVGDLVFVDPPGTGLGAVPSRNDEVLSFSADSVVHAEFVRAWTNQARRWESPKFLLGESYGAARAVGVLEQLVSASIPVAALALLSPGLAYECLDAGADNDLPYAMWFPVYAQAARFHGRSRSGLSVQRSETFAFQRLLPALAGPSTPQTRARLAADYARHTGIARDLVEQNELRVDRALFSSLLRADDGLHIDHFDVRVTTRRSDNYTLISDAPAHALEGMQRLLFEELGQRDHRYEGFSDAVFSRWSWLPGDGRTGGFLHVLPQLRNELDRNPSLRVLLGAGMFDLVTPFPALGYCARRLGTHVSIRRRVTGKLYAAGHFIYQSSHALRALVADLRRLATT